MNRNHTTPSRRHNRRPRTLCRALLVSLLPALASPSAAQSQLPMTLCYDRPARYFEESLPLGNGKLGALVYGGTQTDTLQLNDITLWTGCPADPDEGKGKAEWIPRIREALFNEDYRLADSLQHHVQGHNSAFYQPLATLLIDDLNAGEVTAYRRMLSLDDAVATDQFERDGQLFTREYFVSNPDKVVALRLRAKGSTPLNLRLRLTSLVPHQVKPSSDQLTITGHATGDERETIHFCGLLKAVLPQGGSVEGEDSTLLIYNAREAILTFVNETSFNGADRHPVSAGAPYIENAMNDAWHLVNYSFDQLRQRHVSDYRQLFDRVKLYLAPAKTAADSLTRTRNGVETVTFDPTSLPTDALLRSPSPAGGQKEYLETLYFQYGRYLLISSSRTEGVPANLQGLWTPHLWSPWRGNYTMNINLEENYWPAFVANLEETARPLDGFVAALARNGSHTARNFYGVDKGWCASHNSDIWAMTNPVGEGNDKPEWANWNMGGAWLVNTLYERYLFTADTDYLRRVAYPLMKGAATFCLEWLIDNPRQPGELITAPSTSPENRYVDSQGYHGMTCYGGTADLAIVRELLNNTLAAARQLKTDKALQKQMAHALARLHPYTVGRQGNLQEWYHDWADRDPRHRHQSHLIGLYPGNHLTTQGTRKVLDACRRTLEIKGDETTGWSTGWRINLWARLHDGQQAYHILQKLLTYVSPDGYDGPDKRRSGGTYPNLLDAHPPFQIDGNFGGTAGICEMLMQSTDRHISLLPALPGQWPTGSVSGLRARGGLTVGFSWQDGHVTHVTIKAAKATRVSVDLNGQTRKLKLKAGQTKEL